MHLYCFLASLHHGMLDEVLPLRYVSVRASLDPTEWRKRRSLSYLWLRATYARYSYAYYERSMHRRKCLLDLVILCYTTLEYAYYESYNIHT